MYGIDLMHAFHLYSLFIRRTSVQATTKRKQEKTVDNTRHHYLHKHNYIYTTLIAAVWRFFQFVRMLKSKMYHEYAWLLPTKFNWQHTETGWMNQVHVSIVRMVDLLNIAISLPYIIINTLTKTPATNVQPYSKHWFDTQDHWSYSVDDSVQPFTFTSSYCLCLTQCLPLHFE